MKKAQEAAAPSDGRRLMGETATLERRVQNILRVAGHPELADEGRGAEWRIVSPGWHVFTYQGATRVDWWSEATLDPDPAARKQDHGKLASLRLTLEAAGLAVTAPDASVLEVREALTDCAGPALTPRTGMPAKRREATDDRRSAVRRRFRLQSPLWLLNWAWSRTAAPYVPNSSGEADDLPPGWRWRVMVRTPGGDWTEWCRWAGNDYDGPWSEQDAEARAAQFRQSHPDDEARVEKTQDPAPADFGTTFAPLLHPEGTEEIGQ